MGFPAAGHVSNHIQMRSDGWRARLFSSERQVSSSRALVPTSLGSMSFPQEAPCAHYVRRVMGWKVGKGPGKLNALGLALVWLCQKRKALTDKGHST